MKSKLIKRTIACVVVGAIAVGGFLGYKYFFATKTTTSSNQYISSTARKMNLQVNIQGTGSVYAGTSKDITSNNSGTLQNLSRKVGDTVSIGDSLFTVDSNDLRQNVTKAQNNLEKQKITLASAKNDNEVAVDNLSVKDAQTQLNSAVDSVNKMTVASPINGVITAVNNSNSDSIQSGKAVITVVDPSSMKIKVSVDELSISKVKVGQKSEIKFDALKDKTYEGTVESIAQIGTTTNNSTTYDVVVSISNPTDIKIGMNANVNILVDSKDDALTIPIEALVQKNGKYYVMVPNSDGSTNSNTNSGSSNNQNQSNNSNQSSNGSQSSKRSTQSGNSQGQNSSGYSRSMSGGFSSEGKLVEVTIGLENDNYAEILSGIDEGQKVLIALPTTTSGSSSNNKNAFSGFGGNMGGNMGGNRSQGGSRN